MTSCTIVIPCFNEAQRLDIKAFRHFDCRQYRLRFLFVNDGSSDETLDVLRALHAAAPERIAVLDLPKNAGKAEAVRRGVLRALDEGCDMVGFWDADLATPLESIPGFCDRLDADAMLQMVIGARVKLLGRAIERRPLRHFAGRVFATAASTVLRLPVYDTQCGAKLFRATAEIRSLFEQPFRTKWIFDVELLARYRRFSERANHPPMAKTIYELPLTQWRDVAGSKVRPRDFVKAFFELILIHWTYLRRGATWQALAPVPGEVAANGSTSTRRAA